MLSRAKLIKTLAPATVVAGTILAITRQPLEPESSSNPLRIWEVFQLRL